MITLQIAGIVDDSVVDGPGVRYTIFTQGCAHNCPGCHNTHTHPYNAGQTVTLTDILSDLSLYKYITGVTFSGGEPLDQPEALAYFITGLKSKNYNVIIYTGYTFEQVLHDSKKIQAINKADYLIDGKFLIGQRSFTSKYRGSANQRIIDIKTSLLKGIAVKIEI